jgi:hypothetical protein
MNHKNKNQCDNKMTFEECELTILRNAIDENEHIVGEELVNSDSIQQIITILEEFLIKKKLLCYGGTAINNILPKHAQFYKRDIEIPDYDFFSPNALKDAKELSDIYYKQGYTEVEAKSGVHLGTYKVYVNFMPIADITYINPLLFNSLNKESINIAGIRYVPPNFLRMCMYLELSRPKGDISRWEKVLKRLNILNKYYPLKYNNCLHLKNPNQSQLFNKIMIHIQNSFIEQKAVFIGGFAYNLFANFIKDKQGKRILQNNSILNYDVLHENPENCAFIIMDKLKENGIKNVKQEVIPPFGDIIPKHIDIFVNNKILATIYSPIGCHNYNTILVEDKEVNVATIDTMLSFYLAFIFSDHYKQKRDGILCMANQLFNIQQFNRINQFGLLKRFNIQCIGKQPTLESIRHEKNEMYKRLSKDKDSKEFETYFLNYNPGNIKPKTTSTSTSTTSKSKTSKTKRKTLKKR